MGAVYGILGDAGSEELQAMGTRLEHRGAESAHWSPVSGLWLGVRGSGSAVQAQRDGPIAFDGAIDNRQALALRLGHRPDRVPPAGDGALAAKLWAVMGEEGLAQIAFDGAIDNRQALSLRLGHRPDRAQPAGDGALAAKLWAVLGEEGLAQIAGQFALALWDARGRRLVLARDRVGYAPLYFAVAGERLAFASEYKALLTLDVIPARPNRAALQSIQSTKWVRPGVTCLEGVHPVAPGSLMDVQAGRAASRRYWDIPVRAADLDEAGHARRLRESFLETLRRQTEPYDRIGVSLSGGLDSAVVAAGVRAVAGSREIHTFSAGYGEDDRELVNAAAVAREVGATHHPVVLDPDDLPELLPWMVWHLEEPIGREDIAYLFLAAREASEYVDLIVTGFGFDGLFAGLPRHRLVDLSVKYPAVRGPLEEFFDYTFRSVEPRTLAGRALKKAYFRGREFPAPQILGTPPLAPYTGFPRGGDQPLTEFLKRGFLVLPYQHPVERLYAGVGIRMNAQHTNPDFLATAFAIPDRLKIHGRTQKYILRRACEGLLPPSILATGKSFNRLKHDTRMSATLDRLADDLLSPRTIARRGLIDPAYVARLRRRPAGRPYSQERAYRLWSLLLTELWARRFLDERGAAPGHSLPPVRHLAGGVPDGVPATVGSA